MVDNHKGGSRDYVIVGVKPIMNYVVACMTLFNAGMSRVRVKARGRNISKAVDSIEMLRRVFMKDLKVEDIEIGTDTHTVANGKEASVSTIEIRISRP
ncbi:MAG: DNA-binding protein Alba [Candidatus Bathyarchaeota archaeon]|jgi:DNA-binding protein